ncbi:MULTISPECIES: MFS transporter [Variovorax]|uniref:MFS transporter n=1 Tax=Variovorax TaxID=34072 RepID=UPI002782A56F|nr:MULTISPECIES: MFS transporter [Variovorax]MDQ0042861.1 MFS family permease [Variovorax boronicumulans]MDQ0611817.1 MHS family proline/betaine transporter-like MFS transporter [Variovorax sp. W1I1]
MSEAALPASQMGGAPPTAAAPSSPADTVQAKGKHKGKQTQFRLIAACSLGNALEMYDFTVYSFFALLIGKLFFPSDSPYGSLLLAVATFGIGFVMRPLGGVVIGSYADRKGRKAALTLTIGLMVAGTLCIALAPTYASAGVFGSLMILAGRLLQGFSLGGEVGAATSMLMESGGIRGRGFRVSWQLASQGIAAVLGALTGAALYAALPQASLESWGWRLPFLFGLLIAPVGFYIRANLEETHQARSHESSPMGRLLREHGGTVLKGIFSITAGTAAMYLVVFFMPTYMIRVLHMPPSLSLLSGCATGITMFAVALLSGRLADRLPNRKPLVIGSLVLGVLAVYPAFWLINHYPSVPLVLCLSVLLTAIVNLGTTPLFLILLEMLPIGVRASGISVIYSVGVTVFGGSSQFIVTWLLATTGNPMSPAFYMMACGVLSICALVSLRARRAD